MEGSILKIPAASATAANPDSVVVHVVSAADENQNPLNASIVVTINKKPRPTITPDEVTMAYGDKDKSVGAQATGDGTHEPGAISYAAKSTVDDFASGRDTVRLAAPVAPRARTTSGARTTSSR